MVTDSPLAGVSVMADTMAVTAKLASSLVGDACAVSLDERSQRFSGALPCCKSPSAVNAGLLPMCREAYWADRPRARSARITSSIAANPQHSLTPAGQITPFIKVKYTRSPWKEPVPGVPVDIPKERWAAGGMGLRGGEVAAMTLVASHVVW